MGGARVQAESAGTSSEAPVVRKTVAYFGTWCKLSRLLAGGVWRLGKLDDHQSCLSQCLSSSGLKNSKNEIHRQEGGVGRVYLGA